MGKSSENIWDTNEEHNGIMSYCKDCNKVKRSDVAAVTNPHIRQTGCTRTEFMQRPLSEGDIDQRIVLFGRRLRLASGNC